MYLMEYLAKGRCWDTKTNAQSSKSWNLLNLWLPVILPAGGGGIPCAGTADWRKNCMLEHSRKAANREAGI